MWQKKRENNTKNRTTDVRATVPDCRLEGRRRNLDLQREEDFKLQLQLMTLNEFNGKFFHQLVKIVLKLKQPAGPTWQVTCVIIVAVVLDKRRRGRNVTGLHRGHAGSPGHGWGLAVQVQYSERKQQHMRSGTKETTWQKGADLSQQQNFLQQSYFFICGLEAYPLFGGGETGDSDGQTLFGGGSSSCSSSEELSSVRSITSTLLLLS